MTTSTQRTSWRGSVWVDGLALFAVVALVLWNYWNQLDLGAHDEVTYIRSGLNLREYGISSLQLNRAPVLAILYALLDALPLSSIHLQDAMHSLVAFGACFGLWWCLRAALPSGIALMLAAWFACSDPVTQHALPTLQVSVYLLSAALVFTGLGFFLRKRLYLALCVFLLAILNRSEFGPWVIVLGILAWFAYRAQGDRRAQRAAAVMVLAAGCLFGLQRMDAGVHARSWLAFQQHYALGWHERNPELSSYRSAPEAMARSTGPMTRSFGDAATLGEALTANPSEFVAHVTANAVALPTNLVTTMASGLSWANAARLGLLGAAALLLLYQLLNRPRRRAMAARLRSAPIELWLLLVSSPMLLIGPLLVRPRAEILLSLIGLYLLPLGLLLASTPQAPAGATPPRRLAGLATPILLVVGLLLIGTPLEAGRRSDMLHRNTLALCRDRLPESGAKLIGAGTWGVANLLDPERYQAVELLTMWAQGGAEKIDFLSLVDSERPDWLLVNRYLLAEAPRFVNLQHMIALATGLGENSSPYPHLQLLRLDRLYADPTDTIALEVETSDQAWNYRLSGAGAGEGYLILGIPQVEGVPCGTAAQGRIDAEGNRSGTIPFPADHRYRQVELQAWTCGDEAGFARSNRVSVQAR